VRLVDLRIDDGAGRSVGDLAALSDLSSTLLWSDDAVCADLLRAHREDP
jgi:hypothetical protein